jgi:cytochrome c556
MKHTPILLALALALASALTAPAATGQQARPETFIKWRQSVYQVMVWSSYRIRGNLDGQFNREDVIKAAGILNAIANGGTGGLYPAGTEQGRGWHDTTAKSALFKDTARVRELAGNLGREAEELLRLAREAEPAVVRSQYGRVTQACKACHDEFKVKDG